MLSVDLPVSLKVSLRLSPFSRLMPLNDESCAVVVICAMMLLYWATRLARMAWEAESATGAVGVRPVKAVPTVPGLLEAPAPIVAEAASLVVVKTSLPAPFRLAVRLLAASAAFNWSRDSLGPTGRPGGGPPPVAPIVRVSPDLMPTPSTRLAAVPTATALVTVDLLE